MSSKKGIFNNKGGTGKTTIAVNAAVGVSKVRSMQNGVYGTENKVLLVNVDEQNDANTMLGVPQEIECGINDLFLYPEDTDLKDLVIKEVRPNLDFISMNMTQDTLIYILNEVSVLHKRGFSDLDAYGYFCNVMAKIESLSYKDVIFDLPPAYSILTECMLRYLDEIVVVSLPETGSVKGASRVFGYLNKLSVPTNKVKYLVINGQLSNNGDHKKLVGTLVKFFGDDRGVEVFGPIPRRVTVHRASRIGKSVFEADPEFANDHFTKLIHRMVKNNV